MISSRAACGLWLSGLAVLAAAAIAGGCTVKNPDFCCSSLDSCHQVGATEIVGCTGDAEPYCDDEGMYGPARACTADPHTTSCMGPADCATPALPVCDADRTGTCIGCAVESDCTRFAATPLCDSGSGSCVACLTSDDCGGAEPVCGGDHTCRPCSADSECAGGVCNQAGMCPAAADIIYVDATAPAANMACTQAAPCSTINLGLAVATAARKTMKVAPRHYAEQVVIDGKTLEISAAGADLQFNSNSNPVLDVRNNSNVILSGLRIHEGVGRGVHCDSANLSLREVQVEACVDRGIDTKTCTLTVEQSKVSLNFRGGIFVDGGRATIRNSFVGRNGNGNSSVGGLYLLDPLELTVEFNSIVDNAVSAAAAAGINCSTGNSATVTGNIIVGDNPIQVTATNCAPTYSLSTQMLTGTGDLMGRPTFRNLATGDYHLVAGSLGIDAADPAAMLSTDIDGESRPAGAHADIGADELH